MAESISGGAIDVEQLRISYRQLRKASKKNEETKAAHLL